MVTSSRYFENAHYTPAASKLNKKEIEKSGQGQVTLQWDSVPNAKSYNIYWSLNSGVSKSNGNKIENATNPTTIKDLVAGATYYFIVTVVNESGESAPSKEISYTVSQ